MPVVPPYLKLKFGLMKGIVNRLVPGIRSSTVGAKMKQKSRGPNRS
jgi:hypothetical protein